MWTALSTMLGNTAAAELADGAAAAHGAGPRLEAASKLIGNHTNVLKDLTNNSNKYNIDAKPLTQLELVRVRPAHSAHVDGFLREVARRLLGRAGLAHEVGVMLEPSQPAQASAWAAAATYLEGRIQATPQQKPGRTPDMSI